MTALARWWRWLGADARTVAPDAVVTTWFWTPDGAGGRCRVDYGLAARVERLRTADARVMLPPGKVDP